MTTVQNGHGRCQAPQQNCNESVTELQQALLEGANCPVPGTVTEVQQTVHGTRVAL